MEAQRAASGERDEGTTGASQRAACRAPCSLSVFRAAFLVACCLSLLRQQQEDGLRGPAVHRSELRFVALCCRFLSSPFVSFRFLSFRFLSFLCSFLSSLLSFALLSFPLLAFFTFLCCLRFGFPLSVLRRKEGDSRSDIQSSWGRSKAGAAGPRQEQQIQGGSSRSRADEGETTGSATGHWHRRAVNQAPGLLCAEIMGVFRTVL